MARLSLPIGSARFPVLNARDFGAAGDGTTDDTAAIQAAITAACAPGIDVGRVVYIPAGTYKLTAALTVPNVTGLTIQGASKAITQLLQFGNNIPILSYGTSDANGYVHTLTIADIRLAYNTQQPATNTNSHAVLFGGPTSSQMFSVVFDRVWIGASFRGVTFHTNDNGSHPWLLAFRDVTIGPLTGAAIWAMDPGGKGLMTFDDLYLTNTGGSVVATETAIQLDAAEVQFRALDIEGWQQQHILVSGNSRPALIDGYHMENSVIPDGVGALNEFDDGGVIVRGVLGGVTTQTTGNFHVFHAYNGPGRIVRLEGVSLSVTKTGSGAAYPLRIGTDGPLVFATAVSASGFDAPLVNPADLPSVNALVQVDGMAPAIASLPTASAAYRGRRFRVLGGTGVADATYECRKNASDAYVWVAV